MGKFPGLPDCLLYDEKALLVKIASGDEAAFRKLFDQYKERFYAVALKMTRSDDVAEDIVQDVFMSLWKNRESLSKLDKPSSYFFTAVYRRIYRHYRKLALERKLLQSSPAISESVNTTEETVLADECNKMIAKALSRLPAQQKMVFQLSKEQGMSRDDIARQLDISPHTVKNHLSNALKFIHSFLRNSSLFFLITLWWLKK